MRDLRNRRSDCDVRGRIPPPVQPAPLLDLIESEERIRVVVTQRKLRGVPPPTSHDHIDEMPEDQDLAGRPPDISCGFLPQEPDAFLPGVPIGLDRSDDLLL